MCEICHKTPCDSRCPNAPEPQAVYKCHNCGEPIYDGDDYFEICGEPWCEICIESSRMTAEVEYED